MRLILCIVFLTFVSCSESVSSLATSIFARTSRSEILQVTDLAPDLFIGQIANDVTTPNFIDGRGFSRPSGTAVDTSVTPHRLYVADTFNNRVLVFDDALSFENAAEAIAVIGQPDMFHSTCAAADSDTLCQPTRVAVDSTGTVYISDSGNNRVLAYDAPFKTGGDFRADRVFGQNSMLAKTCNQVSAGALCGPTGVALDALGRLFVVDTGHHRVLVYPTPSTSNVATIVLGQPTLDTGGPNIIDGRGFAYTASVALDTSVSPNRIYVADDGNNRVLGWSNVSSFLSGSAASLVIGQADFSHGLCNRGAPNPSANTLCMPSYVTVDASGNLFIADRGNNRVLGYISPMTTDATPDARWGQSAYTTDTCATDFRTLCSPLFIGTASNGDLFIHDELNGRVLKFLGGITGDTDPDLLFGAATYTEVGTLISTPLAVSAAGHLFGVLDLYQATERVAVWNPSPPDTAPDQTFTTSSFSSSSVVAMNFNRAGELFITLSDSEVRRIAAPLTMFTTQASLGLSSPTMNQIAFDASNNAYVSNVTRVLEFDTPGDLVADHVGGQDTLSSTSPNRQERGGLDLPLDIAIDSGGALYVSDTRNYRVVGWASTNVTTAQLPSTLIGQTSWTASVAAVGPASFVSPSGIATDDARNLYVVDGLFSATRLMRFNAPIINGDSAEAIEPYADTDMGAISCVGTTVFAGHGLSNGFSGGGRGNRVVRLDNAATNLQPDAVLGQIDLAHTQRNFIDGRGLTSPADVAIDTSRTPNGIYVADSLNNRVLGWKDAASLVSGQSADVVIGQATFFDAVSCPSQISASNLCVPTTLDVDGSGRLYVNDATRSRILIFDSPFTNDAVADAVIGTATLTTFTTMGNLPVTGLTVDVEGNLYVTPVERDGNVQNVQNTAHHRQRT